MFHKRLHIKIIVAGLAVSALIISTALGANYDSGSVSEKIGSYYVTSNTIVNEQISSLITYFDDNNDLASLANDETRALLTPPDHADETSCETNLSAVCLNYKLAAEYLLLQVSLQEDLQSIDPATVDITQSSGASNDKRKFIEDQLRQILELQTQTISFYRQILLAYPLHKQFEMTLKELDKFISNLKDFKKNFAKYPSRFHNATTTKCI